MMTPPLGVNLFVACNITGLKLESISKQAFPFIFFMLAGLFVVVFVPALSLLLLK
jgi:C4-dicarboxylate transporter DctM subunit